MIAKPFLPLLLQKFTQSMNHKEIDETKVQLSLMSTSGEVFEYYRKDRSRVVEVIERLLVLKGYELVLRALREEYNHILENEKTLKRMLAILHRNTEVLDDASFLDSLIEVLIGMALNHPFSFESFQICQVISDLVVRNKRFPSKDLAKSYFLKISEFFREGNYFLAYLNSLHILNELGSIEFPKKEFEFLKRCAVLKGERYPKDLFCGIKTRDIESIVVDNLVDTEGFTHDPMWDIVLDDSKPLPDDMKTLTFLMRNRICYECHDNKVRILGHSSEGFTTAVFSIAKFYEPAYVKEETLSTKQMDVDTNEDLEESKLGTGKSALEKDSNILRPPIFKNRFMLPYRQLRIVNRHAPIDFEDRFYQERNEQRIKRFDVMNKKLEEEKAFFISRRRTVDGLFNQLSEVIEKRLANQRADAEERMKVERAQLKEEQRSKMWSNLSKRNTDLSASKNGSARILGAESLDAAKISEGSNLYVPKFRTDDPAKYTPRFRTTDFNPAENIHLPRSFSKDVGLDLERKTDSEKNTNEELSTCNGSWRNARKRKNS